MNLYNGTIDEFVDWKTGLNTFTGQNATGGQSVSGGSIRELLQDKLKNPFYIFEDVENNLYRMFSSRKAYSLWAENPSDYSNLQLFSFVRPSDYKLELTINNGNRFIRSGDSSNLGARIQFSWRIYNDEGDSSDNLAVTYTISNDSTGRSTTFTRWYNRNDANPDFSIYEYLGSGNNNVTIEAKGSSTGARNTVTFNIVLLELSVSSTFDFAGKHALNSPLRVPYVFERNNTDGSAKIRFVIDEGGVGKEFSKDVVKGGQTRVQETLNESVELNAGTHTLLIWAESSYNDGAVSVNSNLLYYTFTVASNEVGAVGKFINIATQFNTGNYPISSLMMTTTQYYPTSLDWGYYTDSLQTNTSVQVTWKILTGEDDANPEVLQTIAAASGEQSSTLQFVPTVYTDQEPTYLGAYFGNTKLLSIPIYIVRNSDLLNIYETGFYELKMSAYGRTNDSSDKDVWKDVTGSVGTTFTNIQWSPNSGWYENSFRTSGINQYAVINFEPFKQFSFTNGKTIEIEFESERVNSTDDVIIRIGSENLARIEITPNKATLYSNANAEILHTNYKANERIKLAFIINNVPSSEEARTVESGLAYIVNNGILERGGIANGQSFDIAGKIKIGGARSGVRIYNLRSYNKDISYTDAYNNYVFDSDNKAAIVNNNNIIDASGNINYDLCKNKLDTILITGNLTNLLDQNTGKEEENTAEVILERTCPTDTSKNFKINNVRIRKHGQSTLNYPIASMKFWLNKSKTDAAPVFVNNPLESLYLNKNRYKMKNTSIPSNKFVLQANYADSSGVHNGGLLRLIQESWYNARIDGEYKLRTLPQLFASSLKVTHNDANLNDVSNAVDGPNEYGKVWSDYFPNNKFPYDIQVSSDSFPCVVFYDNTEGDNKRTFLGQYVFMEDKKSDFLYGERSIYKVAADPFCLTVTHKGEDKKANRIWNNNNVLRIEVLDVNSNYSSYLSNDGFSAYSNGQYGWEKSYEAIYPDPDDMDEDDVKAGLDKSNTLSTFYTKTKPFVDWYNWVVSTKNNQEKFLNEAAQHLDLYKMAAYYIFVLRFALVDSLERNAQIKTYDGVHFHYEPWDMDIALGNKNDGGIAFDPPVDRNTKLPGSVTTYAISGRSADEDGNIATSNWLWDALEAWPYWMNTIVPKVADALFNAGLTYDNVTKMFDDNYANAWCETIYNKSGFFKYVQSGGGDIRWLNWLQGARMSHRHWWLSTSMDYYDAKWFCGDYKNHRIYLAANITADDTKNIIVTPNSSTYMTVTVNYQNDQGETTDEEVQLNISVDQTHPLTYNMRNGASTKAPIHIYGANYIESIDMSQIAIGIDALDLTGTYSQVLGAPIRHLNIGTPITASGSNYTTILSPSTCSISVRQTNVNALENLETLNIRGHMHFGTATEFTFGINQWMYDLNLSQVKNFYAMGSNLINFYSSRSGNDFETVELPSTVAKLEMHNSTWDTIEFWDTAVGANNNATLSKHAVSYNGEVLNIPAKLSEVSLMGTTGSTRNSLEFVREWIKSIVAEEGEAGLSTHRLQMDKINWTSANVGGDTNLLTYSELSKIAQLRGHEDLKGYIVLKNEGSALTAEQLTLIKAWFGDTVFTKNSSGLIVDHKRDYILINVGGDVKVDSEGNLYAEEGDRLSLNATLFSLAEDANEDYLWDASPINAAQNANLTIIQPRDSADGIAYLQVGESRIGDDYNISITCSVDGVPYSTTIKVIGVTYPTDLTLTTYKIGADLVRETPNSLAIWKQNMSFGIKVTSEQGATAEVVSTEYKIENSRSSATYNSITRKESFSNWDDEYLVISSDGDGIVLGAQSYFPEEDQILNYTISATVKFSSGKTISLSKNLMVLQDSNTIVQYSRYSIYNAIKALWKTQYGEELSKNQLYKADLMDLTGTLTFGETADYKLLYLTSNTGESLLKYIPKITGLVFDGCTFAADGTIPLSEQLVFSYVPLLTTLSMRNCKQIALETGTESTFAAEIDLSSNTRLTSVVTTGTNSNVILPNDSNVTTYGVGSPDTIDISNQKRLSMNGITVGGSTRLNSLTLVNIPNNQSFNTYAKIMNLS